SVGFNTGLKSLPKTVTHPVSVIFLYLGFSYFSYLIQKQQFKSMIDSARNTTPQGNNSARLNTGFELSITLIN
ncbi:hypothetical protein, partial [Avibacterium paragallinarum]|uniref:hypothetical protein n=1 Tax=Avibacterium paragallinarum TaxID=728 RepID=UPI001A91ECB7